MTGEATFSDDEGREIARIKVERVESRDGALHVTGRMVPPRIIDGDVLDGEVEGSVPAGESWWRWMPEDVEGVADRAQRAIDEAGGIERILEKYRGIAVNGMTADQTMAALRKKCGLGEVLEGEVIDAGSGVHYPHCNSARCTGCIAQEVVDDCADFASRIGPILSQGLRDLEEAWAERVEHLPRGYHATRVTVDEAARVFDTAGVGFTVSPAYFVDVDFEAYSPGTYVTIDEAREWLNGGRSRYPEARAIEEPRLTWSDIQIKGLGNGT